MEKLKIGAVCFETRNQKPETETASPSSFARERGCGWQFAPVSWLATS
jgi:hypothetical protein